MINKYDRLSEVKMQEGIQRLNRVEKHMTKEQREELLDQWSFTCHCCGREGVSRDEMHMASSVVELEKYPAHSDGVCTKYYMLCGECYEQRKMV